MQFRTSQKGFEPFECKFESLERASNNLNANSNYQYSLQLPMYMYVSIFRSLYLHIILHLSIYASVYPFIIRNLSTFFRPFPSPVDHVSLVLVSTMAVSPTAHALTPTSQKSPFKTLLFLVATTQTNQMPEMSLNWPIKTQQTQ